MYEIDPSRLDLAREFRNRPLGLHSPELQAVLDCMRSMPIDGKHCLIIEKPYALWLLARMTGTPPRPVPVPGVVFTDLATAEWTVFKLRWQTLTGHDLAAAFDEPAIPKSAFEAESASQPDPSRAILAYSDVISVAPGQTIGFKVSCPGIESYRTDIVRLRAPQTGPDGEGFREEEIATPVSGTHRGRVQPLRPGSYISLPNLPEALADGFTLATLAWPTRLAAGVQALFGAWSETSRRGFALHIDAKGALAVRLGDGSRVEDHTTGVPLLERRWYLLAASFDAASRAVELHQIPLDDHGFHPADAISMRYTAAFAPAKPDSSLRIAAWHDGAYFNGKLERPRLARRALARADIERQTADIAASDFESTLLAAWDFSQDIGSDRIIELSPRQLHGRIVNLPARAMTGHNWDGTEMDWRRAPDQYGAIHFHDDDIDDAG